MLLALRSFPKNYLAFSRFLETRPVPSGTFGIFRSVHSLQYCLIFKLLCCFRKSPACPIKLIYYSTLSRSCQEVFIRFLNFFSSAVLTSCVLFTSFPLLPCCQLRARRFSTAYLSYHIVSRLSRTFFLIFSFRCFRFSTAVPDSFYILLHSAKIVKDFSKRNCDFFKISYFPAVLRFLIGKLPAFSPTSCQSPGKMLK